MAPSNNAGTAGQKESLEITSEFAPWRSTLHTQHAFIIALCKHPLLSVCKRNDVCTLHSSLISFSLLWDTMIFEYLLLFLPYSVPQWRRRLLSAMAVTPRVGISSFVDVCEVTLASRAKPLAVISLRKFFVGSLPVFCPKSTYKSSKFFCVGHITFFT